MVKDSKMLLARVEYADEESMSEVDFENSKEDEETDEEEDEEFDEESSEDEHRAGSGEEIEDSKGHEVMCGNVPKEAEVPKTVGPKASQDNDTKDELDPDNLHSEAGSCPGVETVEQENGEVLPGNVKRRRLLGIRDRRQSHNSSLEDFLGIHEGEWDDESEDDDWSPQQALKMQLHWFCTNCTMPNSERLLFCGKCEENCKSGILSQGHLSSARDPVESLASLQGESKIVPEKDNVPALKDSLPGVSSAHLPAVPNTGKTVIGFDERMLLHYETHMKSHPHPERPDRLRAILAGLAAEGLFPGRCVTLPAREITRPELEQVHSGDHVDAVEVTCNKELSYFTTDTYANKDSSLAARLAAGICADLATAIVRGEAQNGFALVRPPGHHAEEVNVMGFCLHNNAGIAAKAAQIAGAKKILILDWDVHHGNGTQDIFDDDPSVLYISIHRHEGGTFYPGTGAATEVGIERGVGCSVNIPWMCSGIGDNDYLFALLHIVLPIAKQFSPDMTIISAGFDAARGDPLGGCEVSPTGYAHMTSLLNSLSGGKMLVVLEGGYNLRSISASAAAVIKVLLGDDPGPLPDVQPTEAGAVSMLEVFAVQSQYWSSLRTPAVVRQMAAQMVAFNSRRKGELALGLTLESYGMDSFNCKASKKGKFKEDCNRLAELCDQGLVCFYCELSRQPGNQKL